MYTLEFQLDDPISFRTITGPGTPIEETSFSLSLARVSGSAPVTWKGLPEAQERIFYAASGSGSVGLPTGDLPLGELQVKRVAGDLSAPPILQATTDDLLVLAISSNLEPPAETATEADLNEMDGMQFPARRWGRSITNGTSPIATTGFTAGLSILGPKGGQVPWHNHPDRQNELYVILQGKAQMCVGDEVVELRGPAAMFIPGTNWHQLTNVDTQLPVPLIYCYEGSVAAPHWWQERDGILPPAGAEENPPLPNGAFPQCTVTDSEEWKRIAGKQF